MVDITNGYEFNREITEYIQFSDFDSRDYGMLLVDRSAPTPSGKDIIEDLPFMQGNYDFSMILGERIFENRTISYTFHLHEYDKMRRKLDQTTLENKLMRVGITNLYDTYSEGYHYRGKAVSVSTQDDHVYNRLIVTITFDCYPFKIGELQEGNDIWDTFNFELDIAQPTKFTVNGTQEITLINNGTPSVKPRIVTSAPFTIRKGNVTTNIGTGVTQSDIFRLDVGENKLTLEGNGTISFQFYKELI